MKLKKPSQGRLQHTIFDNRKSNNHSTHNRHLKSNKQNIIQLTEPLQPNSINSISKQFILSRESLTLNTRPNLQEIAKNSSICYQDNRQKNIKAVNNQQQIFGRRLSLKCTNHSQQLQTQNSQRLSMAVPLRNEIRRGNNYEGEYTYTSQSASFISETKGRQNIKKQVIMTNLINKLEHEEDLRSIIESKLRSGQGYNYSGKDQKNQSYLSDLSAKERKNQSYLFEITEDSNNNYNNTQKLKECQNELRYFKYLMKQMEEKMIELSEQKRFTKKRQKTEDINIADGQLKKDQLVYYINLLQKINPLKCQFCQNHQTKVTKQVATQTSNNGLVPQKNLILNDSFDFFDNLQKTLKVLDEKRK